MGGEWPLIDILVVGLLVWELTRTRRSLREDKEKAAAKAAEAAASEPAAAGAPVAVKAPDAAG